MHANPRSRFTEMNFALNSGCLSWRGAVWKTVLACVLSLGPATQRADAGGEQSVRLRPGPDRAEPRQAGTMRPVRLQSRGADDSPDRVVIPRAARLKLGPGIPANGEFPVAPPVVVDYRRDLAPQAGGRADRPPMIGGRTGPACAGESGDAVGSGPASACGSAAHPAALGGGARTRRAGPSTACFFDIECDDCNACTFDACAEATCSGGDLPGFPCAQDLECGGGTCVPLGSRQCVNAPIPAAFPSSQCDDGRACNGKEFCSGGVCVDGNDDLCAAFPDRVCEESVSACVLPCQTDPDCDDGLLCNGTETCNASTGLCEPDGINPCGPGASCQEPPIGEVDPVCGVGRCCDADQNCSRVTFAECNGIGGTWLSVGLANASCVDTPCPVYSSGIAPQGDFTVLVGPISVSACDPLRIGDDYAVDVSGGPPPDFINVEAVRFVGGAVGDPVRLSVEFWDAAGVFVEDVFLPHDVGAGNVVHTLLLEPPLTVPSQGRIAFTVAANFDPDDRMTVVATDAADVGSNDPNLMFVNGADVTDFLKVCSGGANDGRWCSPLGSPVLSEQACLDGGGSCQPVPNVLAFEIVATAGASPQGACCTAAEGACRVDLPWVCKDQGDVFQGTGSFCKSCSNNILIGCQTIAECPPKACVGGNQDGLSCDTDTDCQPGGTCTGTPICNPVPPACTIQACCDPDGLFGAPGGCLPLQGFCAFDPQIPCARDVDCDGSGPCVNAASPTNECPAGTVTRGFGSFCEPNCCRQSTLSGGSRCLDAPVISITVPPVGQPPVSLTITGSNATATFDEFQQMVCEGGPAPGTLCTGDADCSGGTCTGRLCDLEVFDPNGETRDPGWLEGFEIDACADVRVDLCCTDPVLQPAWAFLISECPCGLVVGNAGVSAPIGLGRGAAGAARGAPFCSDDNLWQTFGPLPPGKYFYPIFSGPGGTFSVPPGGTYQLHVTVAGCKEVACCYLACDSGDNQGQPCTSDGDCPGGGACASACAALNELECDQRGGFWLASENTPDGVDDIISCDASPCAIGACCTEPGQCDDDQPGQECDPLNPSTCMDQPTCAGVLGGTYVGGAGCNFPASACPVCTAENSQGCQFPNGVLAYDVDTFGILGNLRVADDFIAVGNEIRQFCWWPVKFRPISQIPCDPQTEEQWIIRFYEDVGGLPGPQILGSPGPVAITAQAPLTSLANGFQYSVVFDPPIAVEPGRRYWVEISATGDPVGCALNVAGSIDGNGWSLYDIDGQTWTQEDRNQFLEDIAFCVDTGNAGIQIPPPQTGACCDCGGHCDDGKRAEQCLGSLDADGLPVGATVGQWSIGKTCGEVPCESRTAPGDLCETPIAVFEGSTTISNHCSNTDGRSALTCDEGDDRRVISTIASDVWLTYTATSTGVLLIDYCADTGFDAILAVYSDGTSTCPSACPPPLETLVTGVCDDRGCNAIGGGARIETTSASSQCFKIRIASDNLSQTGQGRLDIANECFSSSAPVPELIPNTAGAMVVNTKNRFLSFSAGDPGRNQAVRVKFISLPQPFTIWDGTTLWVGPPKDVSELGGLGFNDPPEGRTFKAAQLQCDPFYTDWSELGVIHVYHVGIVPSQLAAGGGALATPAVYEVQVVDRTCLETFEGSFSNPLILNTSAWSDVGGPFDVDAQLFTAPDLSVDVGTDVIALLDAFASAPGAPSKPRADLEPAILDGKINILEVTRALGAFGGERYPFPPGAPPCG